MKSSAGVLQEGDPLRSVAEAPYADEPPPPSPPGHLFIPPPCFLGSAPWLRAKCPRPETTVSLLRAKSTTDSVDESELVIGTAEALAPLRVGE